MRQVISKILIIAGAALLLVAGGMYTYNRIYDHMAGQRSQELLDNMLADFDWYLPPLDQIAYTPSASTADGNNSTTLDENDLFTDFVRPMRQGRDAATGDEDENTGATGGWTSYERPYSVIGVLSIPQLGVQLAVIGECSDALLGVSCCRLSGGYDPAPYRLVIAGHNIWSHFRGLDTLEIGDIVAFTTLDGATLYYSMIEMTDISGTDGESVLATTGWDLTLLTCKSERTMRTMVRFVAVKVP